MAGHLRIFVTEKDDRAPEVTLYDSLDEAEESLEEFDVENDEYVAWDVEGNRLDLSVESRAGHWLAMAYSGVNDVQGLHSAIQRYAEAVGVPAEAIQQCKPSEALRRIEEFRDQGQGENERTRRWFEFWRHD